MALISQSIPNLINGISQQTATQRNITQSELQENAQSRLVEGLTKRPPLEYSATLATSATSTSNLLVGIQRDADTAFTALFQNGDVDVHNLSGVEKTVNFPNGKTYLNASNPEDMFKHVTVADYTFVVNTSIKPQMLTTVSAAKIERAMVYAKLSNYGAMYEVRVKHPSMSYEIGVQFQMPTGNAYDTDAKFRDTSKIVDILCFGTSSTHWASTADGIGFKTVRTDTGATLSTTQGLKNYSGITSYFTTVIYTSVLDIKPTDGNVNYTVKTADGYGGKAMYAVRDEVQDFIDLPFYAADDTIIKITGDQGDNLSDYYVDFKQEGIWEECVGPGVKTSIDPTTMPHALINNNDGTFTFQQLAWGLRTSGDEYTNADPSFINVQINNVVFYKNRLGFLNGENITLSENGEYYNFFRTTGTDTLDTDPVDIAASSMQVSTLKHAVEYNEQLLLFSDTTQFILKSSDGTLTPSSVSIDATTTFEHDAANEPIPVGNYIYFVQKRGEFSAIREYYADNDTLTNDSVDITAGVSTYLPSQIKTFASAPMEDTMLFAKNQEIYVYKYFWDSNEKIQASWSTWKFDVTIVGMFVVESTIYLYANDGSKFKLFTIDLQNLKDDALTFKVALDHRVKITGGSYNSTTDKTQFTMPYGEKTSLVAVDATNGADLVISNSGATYYVEGNHTSVYFGTQFLTKYKFSTFYLREETPRGSIAVTSGRLQVRSMKLDYQNSGFFTIEVDPANGDTRTYTFNGRIITNPSFLLGTPTILSGTFNIPILAKNDAHDVTIKSTSHLPFHLVAAEYEAFYNRRSQRT